MHTLWDVCLCVLCVSLCVSMYMSLCVCVNEKLMLSLLWIISWLLFSNPNFYFPKLFAVCYLSSPSLELLIPSDLMDLIYVSVMASAPYYCCVQSDSILLFLGSTFY